MGGSARGDFGKTYGSVLDAVSNILAAASLIPGIDTFADLASVPVDLLRGDYVGAGLSVIGAIPVIGEVADAAKTARVVDNVVDAAKAVNKTVDAVKTANRISTNSLIQIQKITMSNKKFIALVDDIRKNGIKESIKYIEYNGKKYVVDGHHRLKAAKQLGIKEILAEKVTLPYKGYKTIEDLFWMD